MTSTTRPTEPKAKRYGSALRALRVAAGMTQEQVADSAGVSHSYLSRVENGLLEPTSEWIRIVAIAIGEHIAEAA